MAKKQKIHKPTPPTGYDLLCQRIKGAINSPRAQREGTVLIAREPGESPEDWERLLEGLETFEEVDLTPQEDGAVRLHWSLPEKE